MSTFSVNLPPCLIGMKAGGSAHHWACKLEGFGHTVELIAHQFVKPYVKTKNNDTADAEAVVIFTLSGANGSIVRSSLARPLLSAASVYLLLSGHTYQTCANLYESGSTIVVHGNSASPLQKRQHLLFAGGSTHVGPACMS